jgi:hypothetical protein
MILTYFKQQTLGSSRTLSNKIDGVEPEMGLEAMFS